MSINGLNINQRNSDFKSNSCCTLVPFWNHADHSYDFSSTCTSLSSITIIRAPLSLTSTKHNATALIIEENIARPRNSCYIVTIPITLVTVIITMSSFFSYSVVFQDMQGRFFVLTALSETFWSSVNICKRSWNFISQLF